MTSELHLFVLWEKARRVEARVLDDLSHQADIEIIGKWELAFSGPAAEAYPASCRIVLPNRKQVLKSLELR